MTDKQIAVKVDHVSKYFKLPTEATNSLRTALVNRFKGIKGYKEQHVLKDISFEVEKGDKLQFWSTPFSRKICEITYYQPQNSLK